MNTFARGNRVERHTAQHSLEKIHKQTLSNIRHYSSDANSLNKRIRELDDEWDIERYLETNASALAFVGILLGVLVNEYWFVLSGLVLLFLFQHAIQGWCPPLPIFRRMGKRTKYEIETERNALKALRGDYASVADTDFAYNAAKKT